MRVIAAPSDVAPVEIAHPVLFSPKPGADAIAAARAAEADEAASKSDQARLAAVTASREAALAMMPVVENLKLTAEAVGRRRAWDLLRRVGRGEGTD
jgi:hypothetical protein